MLLEQDKVTLKLPEYWERWKYMPVSSVGGKWSSKWVWSWKGSLFTVTDVSTNRAIVIFRVRLINCWEATSDCNHTNNGTTRTSRTTETTRTTKNKKTNTPAKGTTRTTGPRRTTGRRQPTTGEPGEPRVKQGNLSNHKNHWNYCIRGYRHIHFSPA